MAKKPTITSITSGYASTNTLNDNFEALRDAFDNTLSLDGSTPNSMTSDLNLNNNDILNASRILVGGVDYIATALSYKNAAEAAQTAAETAQAAAELVYDNFDDRYLGSKASDPTLDNDGDALLDGALYYDTINTVMKFYDTSTATWYRTTPTTSDQANIDIVAGNTTNINTVAGISSDVTTVAGISSDVTTVAADGTDIGTVATSISNVNTAATNISNINTVAGISANVTTVAGNTSNINTVATDISNVNTVAGQTTNLQNVTDNLTAIQNAATNATNAATSASNAATSASNASTSETNAASSATAAAASAAAAASSADFFDDVYLGSKASDPSVDNDGDPLNAGDLYFNTTSNTMRVYSGSAWQDAAVDSSGFVQTTGDTMTGNLSFGDNDKAIFGAGSDLQIYHDGSNSYIDDAGTGALRIRAQDLLLADSVGNPFIAMIDLGTGGSVSLRHNAVEKLATTSTGVDITGTLTSDGLTVDGDATVNLSSGQSFNVFRSPNYATIKIGEDANNNFELHESGNDFFIRETDTSVTKQRIKLSAGGDISFYEDTGTTAKFFWDASAESLGIGTSSPDQKIHVSGAGTQSIRIENTNTNLIVGSVIGSVEFEGNDLGASGVTAAVKAVADSVTGKAALVFDTGTAGSASEAMRIDSSGRVGIGTSSPSNKLSVSDATNAFIAVTNTTAAKTSYIGTTTAGDFEVNAAAASANAVFKTVGSEAMRIDSSGNLLVGTTDSTPYNNNAGTSADRGIALSNSGWLAVARDGQPTAYFNRTQSDGGIVEFRKDGTTVGSIGTASGDAYIATGDVGLRFDDGNNILRPVDNSGLDVDGAINVGKSNARFKDLYLSGGVYLGGTGSANKLDDYEEGTWTPTFTSWTTNPTSASGRYTKVGRLVLITFVGVGGAKASSTSAYIEGLPFAIQGSGAVGSVSNSGVADYGNVLFQNTDRMWFTNNSFTSTWYASGVYETTS